MTDKEFKEQVDLLIKQYFGTTGFWIEHTDDETELLFRKVTFLFDELRRKINSLGISVTC